MLDNESTKTTIVGLEKIEPAPVLAKYPTAISVEKINEIIARVNMLIDIVTAREVRGR